MSGNDYHDYDGVAIECQGMPDAPNKPNFPSQKLNAGIIDRTAARTDQEHISMLIFSDNGVPDRTAAILSGEEEPVLRPPAVRRQAAGAGGLYRHRGALQHRPLLPGQGAGANLHPHPPHGAGGLPGPGQPGLPLPRRAGHRRHDPDGHLPKGAHRPGHGAQSPLPRGPEKSDVYHL